MPTEGSPVTTSGAAIDPPRERLRGNGQRSRPWAWPAVLLVLIVVTAAVTYSVTIYLQDMNQGCGSGKKYTGYLICIELVEPHISTWGGTAPIYSVHCPNIVNPGQDFACWLNFTSTSSYPQNLTNVTVGGFGSPFVLDNLSNPLEVTLNPGQSISEELTILAPWGQGTTAVLTIGATWYTV